MIVNPLKVQGNFQNFNAFDLVHRSFLIVFVFLNCGLFVLNNFLRLSYITTVANQKVSIYVSWSERFCNGKVISYRFSKLLPYGSPEEYEKLIAEYHDFQLLEEIGIPSSEMKIIKPAKDILHDRMWHYLSTLKDWIGCPRFPRLTKVAKLILVIPHSNAEEERVFSLVRKNKTCFRPNLDLDESLASIITCKLAMEGESVTKFSISDDIISTAKQATTKYNKQHSQKE